MPFKQVFPRFLPPLLPRFLPPLRRFLRTPLDLDWLFGWRDLIFVLALISITYGVHLIYRPAAWIVGGLFALAVYYLMIRGAVKAAETAQRTEQQAKAEAERRRQARGTIS